MKSRTLNRFLKAQPKIPALTAALALAFSLSLSGCNDNDDNGGPIPVPGATSSPTSATPGPTSGTPSPSGTPSATATMGPAPTGSTFRARSTFRVPSSGRVAEIVAATPDGRLLFYTDGGARRIGIVNITDISNPRDAGAIRVAGEPTSVAITPDGRFALAVVDPGLLVVIDIATRKIVRTVGLNGQPDSIAISPGGRYAAIAIENQRPDEDAPLPVSPPGTLAILDLLRVGRIGSPLVPRYVSFAGRAGLRFATDPEPEFVDINAQEQAVVTLQENNAVAVVDLRSGAVLRSFSAGAVTRLADTRDDGRAAFTDTLTNARREPDGVAWTRGGNIVTANEGDYDLDLADGQFVGGRGFSVFSPTGQVLFDSGVALEQAVATAGLYDDGRSDRRGIEAEGAEIGLFGTQQFAFIALERADAIAVYRLDSETRPTLSQILRTGDAPEGVLAIPSRGLLVSANEGDGTISIFSL